jgi:multiple sugar transport system ATP-binding protein
MVAGLEEITEGTISIAGKVVNHVAPKERDIAMVFQNYALYPHMTVYKNLAFGLKMRKYKKELIQERVEKTAKLLGLEELLERKPKALSGGQRQRVAVGRAIVRNPKAFLFDEPLSNLDAKLRGTMRAELKELHRRLQTTSIYVTHDQEEAMSLGDRIVVMCDGLIRQVGNPLEIYDNPADRFVAGFVGMPPMNFFDGTIQRQDGKLIFKFSNDAVELPANLQGPLGAYEGKPMVLGSRPEHMTPVELSSDQGNKNFLQMKIRVTEKLGGWQDVFMLYGDMPIVARCDAHMHVPDEGEVAVQFDMNRVHLFEPGDLGVNVTLNIRDQQT